MLALPVGLVNCICDRLYLAHGKKNTRKIYFTQQYQQSENWGKCRIYSPLTPDQPPLKGGRYLIPTISFPLSEWVPRTGYFSPGATGQGSWILCLVSNAWSLLGSSRSPHLTKATRPYTEQRATQRKVQCQGGKPPYPSTCVTSIKGVRGNM